MKHLFIFLSLFSVFTTSAQFIDSAAFSKYVKDSLADKKPIQAFQLRKVLDGGYALGKKRDDSLYKESAFDSRDMAVGTQVILQKLEAGGLYDSIVIPTRSGALTTATLSKAGIYDKVAVTGGDYNSYLSFPDKFISDNQVLIKASVRVSNLNADGTSGTAWFGLGTHGVQSAFDTGTPFPGMMSIELIGKTGYNQSLNSGGAGVTSSGGTLCSNGDILDVEFKKDVINSALSLTIVNRGTGQWCQSIVSPVSPTYLGIATGVLRINMSNATFTLLDVTAIASVPEHPLLATIGDSYTSGFNDYTSKGLIAKLSALSPHFFFSGSGNGGYIYTQSTKQMQNVARVKPKYVLEVTVLSVYYGHFRSAHAEYANFMAAFNSIQKQIIACGGTPVWIKWPPGPYTNGNQVDWAAFLDAEKAIFPTAKIIDERTRPLTYDGTGHLDNNGFSVLAGDVYSSLKAWGN